MKPKHLLMIFFLTLISCNEEVSVLKQKIFFEKHYVNMAWIPQSSGFLIDSLGNVLEFNWVEVSHSWYDADSTGHISNKAMDENISYCQINNYHINSDTLKHYVDKIYASSKGMILTPEHIMADAGTTAYYAFIFDVKTDLYKQILLKTDGDISTINNTAEAKEIYQWLSSIGK